MIEVKAPGKIMLAGEWSILEQGNSCIVLPVNKFVTARIQESKKIIFNSGDIGLKNVVLQWDSVKNDISLADSANISEEQKSRFKLCFTAIQKSLQFLSEQGVEIKPFELTVISEISNINVNDPSIQICFANSLGTSGLNKPAPSLRPTWLRRAGCGECARSARIEPSPGLSAEAPLGAKEEGRRARTQKYSTKPVLSKPGLGSSAAVTVAVCKSILKFHDFDIDSVETPKLVFKLACLSHYFASGKLGSGFDVACSTYQKPIVYSRFDQIWLDQKLADIKKISEVVLSDWPGLRINQIKLPDKMQVLIGFVGYSASTTKMIGEMNLFKNSRPEIYQSIIQSINSVVLNLISAIQKNNQFQIINLIKRNRELLVELSDKSGVGLETQELRQMIEIVQSFGAAAKISGAGGGDCGIAVCFDDMIAKRISREWNCAGIAVYLT